MVSHREGQAGPGQGPDGKHRRPDSPGGLTPTGLLLGPPWAKPNQKVRGPRALWVWSLAAEPPEAQSTGEGVVSGAGGQRGW